MKHGLKMSRVYGEALTAEENAPPQMREKKLKEIHHAISETLINSVFL